MSNLRNCQTIVRFEGIDGFNRAVFKDIDSRARFGSVDILYAWNATEKMVKEDITEKDLLYFGNSFGCEPMGTSPGPIEIEWEPEL